MVHRAIRIQLKLGSLPEIETIIKASSDAYTGQSQSIKVEHRTPVISYVFRRCGLVSIFEM
jgi:hypothetical protein